MVDTQLLDRKIKNSGLKSSFIISNLGISRQGFYRKKKGDIPFRVSEVYVLSDLLRLSDEEKTKIFFPKG